MSANDDVFTAPDMIDHSEQFTSPPDRKALESLV
jgi:hypothetical protein